MIKFMIGIMVGGTIDCFTAEILAVGKFTVITDLSGNKTAMLCSAKSLRQILTAGEGII